MATVAEIVKGAHERADRIAVVVSALGGATDQLVELVESRAREHALSELELRHRAAALSLSDLAATTAVEELLAQLQAFAHALPDDPAAVTLEQRDLAMSFGERLSVPLVAAALRRHGIDAATCDTRDLITTSDRFGSAEVDHDASFKKISERFNQSAALLVTTGFLGSTVDGRTTTLGRGGSDLTAALLGAALNAAEIEIWTDVDGVLNADPRVVDDAFSIPNLSYEEVMELAHFGAEVLYPPTVTPARARKIPIRILNTLNPSFEGTLICSASSLREPAQDSSCTSPFAGITAIADVSLLTLGGSGLLGVTGTAHRFFGALANVNCNVILISQASSEHSICCAVPPEQAQSARVAVDLEFAAERARGRVQAVRIEPSLSVVAAVGAGMRERPGIAGLVFSILGENRINVRAIAQGSSELNISVVVRAGDREAAVRALHRAMFGAPPAPATIPLNVVVAGVGGVGAEVLKMVQGQPERLRLSGIIASQHQLLADIDAVTTATDAPTDSGGWRALMKEQGEANDPEGLVAWFHERANKPGRTACALVDCTASSSVTELYPQLVDAGIAIVAANKLGVAADLSADTSLQWRSTGRAHEPAGQFGFEATVGAGLPVISTLRSLLESGDRILEISGVFSGTLGFLLDQVRSGASASEAIKTAYDNGFTEPDPRDDLSGTDVARKLLILARVCGVSGSIDDVAVEPLIPLDAAASIEDFWQTLDSANEAIDARLRSATDSGDSLAYLARAQFAEDGEVTAGVELSVGLRQLPSSHPACQLRGSDNLFLFRTERYREQPLIIRGPGAGTTVTAAGVMTDLLAIAAHAGEGS